MKDISNKAEFIKVVSCYEGKVVDNGDNIWIEDTHEIGNGYGGKKKALCKIGLNKYGLFGSESTYSVIGGFGTHFRDDEYLINQLERYGFKRRTMCQMSIEDL